MKLATIVVGGKPLYTWEELRRKLGDSQPEIDAAKAELETAAIMDLIVNAPEPVQPRPQLEPVAA
jgi:hypothetical protein